MNDCTGFEVGWYCYGGSYTPAANDVCASVCGDGFIVGTEECDNDPNVYTDGCDSNCMEMLGWDCTGMVPGTSCLEICGDGLKVGAETCDDGDNTDGIGCTADCLDEEEGWHCDGATPDVCTTMCGDGVRNGVEVCDDGSAGIWHDYKGCLSDCTGAISGWTCADDLGTAVIMDVCYTDCGDGFRIIPGEDCEQRDYDVEGCSATCTVENGWICDGAEPNSLCTEVCGDGILVGSEECDNNDAFEDDGCYADCTLVDGWDCAITGPGVTCAGICGDDRKVEAEVCDDGDSDDTTGCKNDCSAINAGWQCTGGDSGRLSGTPALDTCTEICGDGLIVGAEQCDNNPLYNLDGCDANCMAIVGWDCTGMTPLANVLEFVGIQEEWRWRHVTMETI